MAVAVDIDVTLEVPTQPIERQLPRAQLADQAAEHGWDDLFSSDREGCDAGPKRASNDIHREADEVSRCERDSNPLEGHLPGQAGRDLRRERSDRLRVGPHVLHCPQVDLEMARR